MTADSTPWWLASFRELSAEDLYAILVVRARVFIVEQNCAYLDLDGLDAGALHLWTGRPVRAYLRILAPGSKYEEPSLGRVVTAPEARRQGLGRALVAEGIKRAEAAFGV